VEGRDYAAKLIKEKADAEQEILTMQGVGKHHNVVLMAGSCPVPPEEVEDLGGHPWSWCMSSCMEGT